MILMNCILIINVQEKRVSEISSKQEVEMCTQNDTMILRYDTMIPVTNYKINSILFIVMMFIVIYLLLA